MAGENMEFFRKFTTLVSGVYYSDPYDVSGQKAITLQVMFAEGIGTTPTVTAQLQHSADLQSEAFADLGSSVAPAEGAVASTTVSDPLRYVRLKVTIGGSSNPAATFWAKAVARDA